MLLRRVMKHVRDQNWFAVGIDFVIVVTGVFIGIQVANWNTERQNRALADGYIERLHHEIVELIDKGAEAVRANDEKNRLLWEVQTYLDATGGEAPDLGPQHCRAIVRSHIYARGIILPPTLSELLATGRVALIDDEALRTSIASFAQSINEIGQLRNDIQIDRLPLARRYPQFITLSARAWDQSVCLFDQMRHANDFRNDLADNAYRFEAFAVNVLAEQLHLQQELHAHIDRRLNVDHESAATP